jgi:hypothetical protein
MDGLYMKEVFHLSASKIVITIYNIRSVSFFKVVNDIKSNPKLSVVGKVMVGPNTFLDNSNSIKNLSVMAFKGRNSSIQLGFLFPGSAIAAEIEFIFFKMENQYFILSLPYISCIQTLFRQLFLFML